MKTPLFQGACTALVTPYSETGINFDRLKQNLDFQYENGVSAVVVCGTTGENATQTEEEHNELVRCAINYTRKRMKVIVGVGSNNTLHALKNAENARAMGADGILMVTPYYNKTTQKGLVEHFCYVADRVDLPMILYNVPSRTGIGIQAETYKILSAHPNISGVKEASGDLSLALRVRSICGDDLFLWSGNDDNTIAMMSIGALGVISVASNILPAVVSRLCELCLAQDFSAANELYAKYAELFRLLFIETNPIPVKAAMQQMGMDSGLLRLPLTQIEEDHLSMLRFEMQKLGLII